MTSDQELAIGIVGLGLLGSAIAERLLQCGYNVTGFDLKADCCQTFQNLGGHVAASAVQVFQSSDVVVLSLPDSATVRQLIQSADAEWNPQLIIDTTTGRPQDSVAAAEELAGHGVRYVDATVAGSSEQARRGEVVVMAGGTPDAFVQALPILRCFSSQQFHTGPSGSGATVKLIVNLVLGLNRAVLAEGLNLARCCGVDLPLILEILQSGAAYSRVMDTKGQKMVEADFKPQARLDQHWKDVRLILQLGDERSAQLPLSKLHEQLLRNVSELGFGGLDNSAIIKAFEANAR